jgi:hypothetical protein
LVWSTGSGWLLKSVARVFRLSLQPFAMVYSKCRHKDFLSKVTNFRPDFFDKKVSVFKFLEQINGVTNFVSLDL